MPGVSSAKVAKEYAKQSLKQKKAFHFLILHEHDSFNLLISKGSINRILQNNRNREEVII